MRVLTPLEEVEFALTHSRQCIRDLEQQRDKLLAALKPLMDDNTGGTWGLPASHKDTIAARAIIDEIEAWK